MRLVSMKNYIQNISLNILTCNFIVRYAELQFFLFNLGGNLRSCWTNCLVIVLNMGNLNKVCAVKCDMTGIYIWFLRHIRNLKSKSEISLSIANMTFFFIKSAFLKCNWFINVLKEGVKILLIDQIKVILKRLNNDFILFITCNSCQLIFLCVYVL